MDSFVCVLEVLSIEIGCIKCVILGSFSISNKTVDFCKVNICGQILGFGVEYIPVACGKIFAELLLNFDSFGFEVIVGKQRACLLNGFPTFLVIRFKSFFVGSLNSSELIFYTAFFIK